MAPLVKDTLHQSNETLTPIAESHLPASAPAPAAPAKSSGGGLRHDALSLEVPVRVHGSRVTEVARGIAPRTEPFEEQTSTMIVFPLGAVLRLVTPANVGQMLVLTNLRTKQDAICRVVKVRTNANQQAYVEVEFTSRQAGYWGVHFPSDPVAPGSRLASAPPAPAAPSVTPSVAQHVAPPAPAAAPRPANPASDVSWAPARPAAVPPAQQPSAPAPNALDASSSSTASSNVEAFIVPAPAQRPVPKPESAFISIGAQEKTQPAASATVGTRPGRPAENSSATLAAHTVPAGSAAAPDLSAIPMPEPPPASASISMSELLGDSTIAEPDGTSESSAAESAAAAPHQAESFDAAESSAEAPRRTFGSFTGGAAFGASHAAEGFGAAVHTGSSAEASVSSAGAPRKNWVLVAAVVGGVLIAAAGAFYFRPHAARPASALSASAAPLTSSGPSSAAAPATQNPDQPAPPQAFVSSPAVGAGAPAARKAENFAAASSAAASSVPASSAPAPRAAKPAPPAVSNDRLSATLNAHPVAAQSGAAAAGAVAPTYGAEASTASAALPGAISTSSNFNLAIPSITPEGPVKIGGNVKQPKLVHYVAPIYPAIAKQAGVSGNVVIEALIDKAGHVSQMKVLSGPPMLRGAALGAVHEWRYQPSVLDGEPVSVQMSVTVEFRQ